MFKTIIEPRVSETDGVGHINNTVLPVWFEAGRHELFKLFNPKHDFDDWRMVIINTNISYKSQLYFGNHIEVKMWIKKIGNSSLELYEEIWQLDKLCATSNTIYVNYNKKFEKTERIPNNIRMKLEKHLYKEDIILE